MGSFKLKLVAYFLLLTLLPLTAAFWGFTAVARKSETRRVDARLEAGLRASLAVYQDELDAAERAAAALARDRHFQRALDEHDRSALAAYLAQHSNLRVQTNDGFHVGRPAR